LDPFLRVVVVDHEAVRTEAPGEGVEAGGGFAFGSLGTGGKLGF
jgi:hypothetical protein